MTEKTYGLNVLLDLCGGTEEAVQSLLPHYVLRNDGLWLDRHASDELALAWDQADAIGARPDLDLRKARRLSAKCVGRSWTPSGDSGKPALPIPFNVRQFTAFSLAGGGMALIELFDFGAVVDEGELKPLPADASENQRASHADLVQRLRAADHAAAAELEAALQSLGEDAKDAKDAKELVRAALPLLDEATAKFGRDDAGVRSAADWLLCGAQEPAQASDAVAGVAPLKPYSHAVKGRAEPLAAVLKLAKDKALDPYNWTNVWAELVGIAQRDDRPRPLLGYTEGEGVKYETYKHEDPVGWLSRDAFRQRAQKRGGLS